MSFNSIIFILCFLPVSVLGYYALSMSPVHRLRLAFLVAMSLAFYGRAQMHSVPLLLGSVTFNYVIARLMVKYRDRPGLMKGLRTFGVTVDAGLLLETSPDLGFYRNAAVEGIGNTSGVKLDAGMRYRF